MIDFTLTENDKAQLARVRAEALICRKYARYYEEREGEFPPDELPEAAEFYASAAPLPATVSLTFCLSAAPVATSMPWACLLSRRGSIPS